MTAGSGHARIVSMFYERLFAKLQEEQVEYLVLGGVALNLHGVPRMTADVDITISFATENTESFLRAAAALDLKPKAPIPAAALADRIQRQLWRNEKNMIAFGLVNQDNPLEEVDVLLETPFSFKDAYDRRFVVHVDDLQISVASLEDLIASKEAAGRKQDLADIDALRALKQVLMETDE